MEVHYALWAPSEVWRKSHQFKYLKKSTLCMQTMKYG